MSKLLNIQASPRVDRSYSRAVSDAFVAAYQAAHPKDATRDLDLYTVSLPPFDGRTVDAKYKILHGEKHTLEEINAWKAIEVLIEDFKESDKFLLSLPMWNFGIPYRLKHYFDLIIQPGYTFSFDPEAGYSGLVTGKPIAVVYARGGAYAPGTEAATMDFQKPYVEIILGFMGFTDIRSIVVEPTLAGGPDGAEAARAMAIHDAEAIAKSF